METKDKDLLEEKVVGLMVEDYCLKHHKTNGGICDECRELVEYVNLRSRNCPNKGTKTYCSKCPQPCYSPKMKEKIRKVMIYSARRMMIKHPLLMIKLMMAKMKRK